MSQINSINIPLLIKLFFKPTIINPIYLRKHNLPPFFLHYLPPLKTMSRSVFKQEEEFTLPSQIYKSKLPLKQQKIIRKQNLRNKTNIPKMIVESQNQDLEEKQQQYAKKKAKKWWKSFNKKYFHIFDCLDEAQKIINKIQELPLNGQQLQSYFQEEICKKESSNNRYLLRKDTIRVILRRQIMLDQMQDNCLLFFQINNSDTNAMIDQQTQNSLININGQKILLFPKIEQRLPSNINIASFRCFSKDTRGFQNKTTLIEKYPQPTQLSLISVQSSDQEIQKLLRLEKQKQSDCFIDHQIKQWTKKYHEIFQNNQISLQNLAARVEENIDKRKLQEQLRQRQQEVVLLTQKELLWSQILLLFKKGHSDKTEELLNDALEIITIKEMSMKESMRKKKSTSVEKLKSLFETDCKICFSTQNDEKINKVFYCDGCNTSFHQICYGISKQEAQEILKLEKYYCDVCNYSMVKKPGNLSKRLSSSVSLQNEMKLSDKSETKQKKPSCQICCKSNFPMKLIIGHFYHVTCLFMFDFAEVRDSKITLKEGYDIESLLIRVMQNEQESGFCDFCSKNSGMKFKCRDQKCNKWYHPICGYLNGIYFDLKREFRKLRVRLYCYQHQPVEDRRIINQIYIRRFFCDYKKTTNLTEEDFQQQYAKQLRELTKQKNKQLTAPSNLLLRKYRSFKIPSTAPLHNINGPGLKRNPSEILNYESCQNIKMQQSMAQSSQQNELQIQRNELFHKIDHARFIEQDLDFD